MEGTRLPAEPPENASASNTLWGRARRVALAVVGATVILFGLALLVLPGPGILVVLAGLSILALEFAWARRLLKKARDAATRKPGRPADGDPTA